MTGLAAVHARISSIQDRMSELGLTQASGGAVMGGVQRTSGGATAGVPAAGGAQFAGMLGSLTQSDGAGGTTTAGLFGYVPAGTKLATIPGTQAYAQAAAEAAAALAAQQEAAHRATAITAASVSASASGADAAGARAGTSAGAAVAGAAEAGSVNAVAAGAVAAPRAASGGAGGGSGKPTGSREPAGSGGVAGAVGGAAPSAPVAAPIAVPAPTSGGLTGQRVVDTAKKYLGVPYVWGGETRKGLDCSGLVQRTFLDHGIKLPRTARALMKAGTEVPSLAQAQPGDLIITRGGGHVSIYMGDNKIIHAPYKGEVVKIQKNYSTDATIDTIRRIV